MIRRSEWIVLGVIVVVYFALAAMYAVRTPDWQAPDEPAHYNYIRQIADDLALPVLKRGDWNQDDQERLKASGFAPAVMECYHLMKGGVCVGMEVIQYEDHQPPLYYLLQAPVYALTGGDLLALRLVSALLGAGVVICAWAALRRLFPGWPVLALAGAGFIAFLPQHLSILGSVSNDALAELIAAATLLAVVVYVVGPSPADLTGGAQQTAPLQIGILVGLALITKTTIYFLGGIAALAVLLRWRRARWPWRKAARHFAAVLIPALIIGGVWWARNVIVYGGLDFTGLGRHDEVVIGQTRTADYIDGTCQGSTRCYLENFAETTFHSFWGQFGWMAVPMPMNIYRVLLLGTLGLLAGAALFAWRFVRTLSGPQRDALIVFAAVIVLVAAEYVLYNRSFVQFQGRYLYPALIPLALIAVAGLSGWSSLVETRFPVSRFPVLVWLPVVVIFGLALFAWYALDTYLVPNLPGW